TRFGGIFAGVLFLAGVIILGLGMLSYIDQIYDKEIPALVLATQTNTVIANLFAISLILAIYTTAVPMMCTAINKIEKDDTNRKYKIVAVILVILGFIGGHLKFSTMVGIVYPATGVMGIIVFLGMLYTKLIKKPEPRKPSSGVTKDNE